MESKICIKCGIDKPITNYHKSNKHISGRKNICDECTNKYARNKRNVFNSNGHKVIFDRYVFFNLTKDDFEQKDILLTNLGYDVSKDVSEQFLDRVEQRTGKRLPNKEREPDVVDKVLRKLDNK